MKQRSDEKCQASHRERSTTTTFKKDEGSRETMISATLFRYYTVVIYLSLFLQREITIFPSEAIFKQLLT